MSLVGRILGGIGAGANMTVCMAISISFDADERQKYIGMIEAAQGLGLLIGPPFGSLLNYYGGYACPFYTFGKLFIYF